jgi:PmbA protein
MTDYLNIANNVVAETSAQGVEAEAYILDELETEIQLGNGEVEKLSQSNSRGIGVRVIDEGRVGYAYSSDFSKVGIKQTWEKAVELAAVASEDDIRTLPEPQPISEDDLNIWDPDLPTVTPEEKIDLLKMVTQSALEYDKRVAMVPLSVYVDAISHVYLANSKGFSDSYDRTTTGTYCLVIGRDEDGNTSESFGLGFSNYFKDLDPVVIGREGAQRAVAILGGESIPTQSCSVVFSPIVFSSILGYISMAMTAEAMQKGRSFLLDKVGKEIASDKVILLDNGHMKGGLSSAPFDAEGVPTTATRLIDEGVFQGVVYDSYTARKDGETSTGNATRSSHRSVPSLGMSNFYLQPGNKSQEEIIKTVDNGMYVTSIMQVGGIDPVSGDCSMGAYGLWIENGELTKPVSGVTIATTLFDLLMNISEVGNDLIFTPFVGVVGTPTVRVDNMTLGGK